MKMAVRVIGSSAVDIASRMFYFIQAKEDVMRPEMFYENLPEKLEKEEDKPSKRHKDPKKSAEGSACHCSFAFLAMLRRAEKD